MTSASQPVESRASLSRPRRLAGPALRYEVQHRLRLGVLFLLVLAVASVVRAQSHAELLAGLRWDYRVLLVFAPDEQSSELQAQRAQFQDHLAKLRERDLLVIEVVADRVGLDPVAPPNLLDVSAAGLREHFQVDERAFAVLLVGKDGQLKLFNTELLPVERLFGVIDAMPMRQLESRERRPHGDHAD